MTKARNMGTADHGCKVTYSSLITGTFRRSWGKKSRNLRHLKYGASSLAPEQHISVWPAEFIGIPTWSPDTPGNSWRLLAGGPKATGESP